MSTRMDRSNIVCRSNVCHRQRRESLHSDTAYVQRVRGGHSIRLLAKAIAMASNDSQISALVEQSAFFTPLQKRDYAERFVRAAGTASYGWDLDAEGRIVWKPINSLGSRLLRPMTVGGGTSTTNDQCWFVGQDGRIDWGTVLEQCRPLLQDQAQS